MRLKNVLPQSKIAQLKRMDDQELINEFAPVLYFHEEENWLPASYERMLGRAVLRRDHSREEVTYDSKPFSQHFLQERKNCLTELSDSHKYYLDLPEVEVDKLKTHREGRVRYGLVEVINAAVKHYGNKPIPGVREYRGKCYAKVRKFPVDDLSRSVLRNFFGDGNWIFLQYYFFYLFNAATNVHEGDWDSSITVGINLDTRRTLVAYYQHHTRWLTRMNTNPMVTLAEWIDDWDDYEKKDSRWGPYKPPAFSFTINGTHPIGFVAKGAHGIYPTSGTTMFGIDIPFSDDELPFTVDDRTAGICVAPQEVIGDMDVWPSGLIVPDELYEFDEPEIIPDERAKDERVSVLCFQGNWGEKVRHKRGWSGPQSPVWSAAWGDFLNAGHFENLLDDDYHHWWERYFRGGPFRSKVLQLEHTL